MSSLNKVMILGNLGKDPELKQSDRAAVTKLAVATSTKFKTASGDYAEDTQWHNVVCFGKTAENCAKYLQKGSRVFVEGRLQTRSYEHEGQKKWITEIIGENVQFLGSNQNETGTDEIPF